MAENQLEFYKKLVDHFPEIDLKGKTMPYTSVNGHMFSFLSKDGIFALRMSDEDHEKFVAEYKTPPVQQYGSIMKEYVEIPVDLLEDTGKMKKYFEKSYAYVSGLKPKAGSKK